MVDKNGVQPPYIYVDPNFEHQDPYANASREWEVQTAHDLFQPIIPIFLRMDLSWLVDGFLPHRYLAILAGDPKEGKTCFATALALAVATGTPFAGMNTNQAAVLWIAAEETHCERRIILQTSPLVDADTPLYTCHDHLPIDDPESIETITEWVRRTGAGLLVVDPLHAATSGRSLTDGWAARRTLKCLKFLCRTTGIACVVLHHATMPSAFPHVEESLKAPSSPQPPASIGSSPKGLYVTPASCRQSRILTVAPASCRHKKTLRKAQCAS